MPIPLTILDEIKQRLPLANYLERCGISLKPSGSKRMKCICPFHDDKKPSMTISLDHDTFKCWVCDVGGDLFEWVMKTDGLEFRDAVQKCADIAGVVIPDDRSPESPEQQKKRETIAELMSQAEEIRFVCAVQWNSNLFKHSGRRPIYREKFDYQTRSRSDGGRYRDEHILDEWEVGCTVDGDETLKKVKERLAEKGKNYSQNAYLASGLFVLNEHGALQSLYRNCYTYPQPSSRIIMDADGKPEHQAVSCISMKPFDGREKKLRQLSEAEIILDGEKIKIPTVSDGRKSMSFWLNPADLRHPRLIIVEGENDLLAVAEGLAMMQDGDKYRVCGIAGNPSDDQIKEFARYRQGDKKTYLMFDSDYAGGQYAWRFSKIMLEDEIDIENIRALEWGLVDMSVSDIDDVLTTVEPSGRGELLAEVLSYCHPYYDYLINEMREV